MQKAQFAFSLLVLAAVIAATSRPAVELVTSGPTPVAQSASLQGYEAPVADRAIIACSDEAGSRAQPSLLLP